MQEITHHNIEARSMIRCTLAEVLSNKGRSLYWLAKTTGLDYSSLWKLAQNKSKGVKHDTLNLLCEALDCLPGDLYEYQPNKKRKK